MEKAASNKRPVLRYGDHATTRRSVPRSNASRVEKDVSEVIVSRTGYKVVAITQRASMTSKAGSHQA